MSNKKDPVSAGEYYARIPDGTYTAQCFKHEQGYVFGESKKLYLWYRILTESAYHGTEIFQAFNMPKNRRVGVGSKYYMAWCMANGWRKPTRNAKMSPQIFKSKVFKIKTRTVERNGMPESFNYSVVDSILSVQA